MPNSSPLRIGLLGCGDIASVAHIPLLAKHAGARIVAFADADSARLSAARASAPEAHAVKDFRAVLAMPEVDAVVVALPPALHATAAIEALERGKHVYVEKPLATSLDEGRRLIDAWASVPMRRTAMMGFNARRNPNVMRARKLIASGKIGTPVAARTVFSTSARQQPEWKRSRSSGGGVLLDLAVHHVDLLRHLLDTDVVDVAAELRSHRSEQDTALLELRLASGCVAQSFFSLSSVEEDRIEIYGSAAKLTVDRYQSLGVEVTPAAARGALSYAVGRLIREWSALPYALRRRTEPLTEPSFRATLDAFVRAARTGERATPDLVDGLRALAVVTAAESSARSGRVTPVEKVGDPLLPHASAVHDAQR
ncbi:MAG TPA: Gfo/Idh/MocA family oxidoreductase [Gemmatimonadaceae bacterium]|nr:Gfo/Idh/MocA family oxidoreductase [Gemmatimonadaceae bacterium]